VPDTATRGDTPSSGADSWPMPARRRPFHARGPGFRPAGRLPIPHTTPDSGIWQESSGAPLAGGPSPDPCRIPTPVVVGDRTAGNDGPRKPAGGRSVLGSRDPGRSAAPKRHLRPHPVVSGNNSERRRRAPGRRRRAPGRRRRAPGRRRRAPGRRRRSSSGGGHVVRRRPRSSGGGDVLRAATTFVGRVRAPLRVPRRPAGLEAANARPCCGRRPTRRAGTARRRAPA
jgi:hypothetical protein